ncbi:MAG TPA: GtrA family protein [Beijerinckiaceae bacterium]
MSSASDSLALWARQFTTFFGVGLVAAAVHFGLLVGLVELAGVRPVPATLVGYVTATIVSYLLNRRLTYASDRPHAEAAWRFAVVAGIGFLITWALMALFIRLVGPTWYFPAQMLTTGIVLFWHFLGHKLWTFRQAPPPRGKTESAKRIG